MSGAPPAQEPHPLMPAFHPGRMVLLIERGEPGSLLVSCPHLPGWRATSRSPEALARLLDSAWQEHAIRAYANSRGEEYDLTHLADDEPAPRPRRPVVRGDWREQDDGSWLSPAGHRYPPDTAVVRKVRAKREGAG